MVNIHKLMTAVKKGTLSFGPFNLRRKKANSNDPNDPEYWTDEAIAAREQAQQSQQAQQAVQDTGVIPSDRVVNQSDQDLSTPQISEEAQYIIDTWIQNNLQNIEYMKLDEEGRTQEWSGGGEWGGETMEELEEKEFKQWDEGNATEQNLLDSPYFLAAPDLYRLVSGDPGMYEKVLVKKIMENTSIDNPISAKKVVDTFEAKSEALMREMGEVASVTKAEEEEKKQLELERRKKEERLEQLKKKDIYAIPKDWGDPKLDQIFLDKYLDHDRNAIEKSLLREAVNNASFDHLANQPAEAVRYRLGVPAEGAITDQRMNFFLTFPQELNKVMDPELEAALTEELPKVGVQFASEENPEGAEDIYSGLNMVRDWKAGEKSQGRIRNILNNVKGPQLYDVLKGLIEASDPLIYKWVGLSIFSKDKPSEAISYSEGSEEGQGVGNVGLIGKDKEKNTPIIMDKYEQYEANEVLGKIGTKYLTPILEKASGVVSKTVASMSSDQTNKYKKALEDFTQATTETAKKRATISMNDAMSKYYFSEVLRAFSSPIIKHMEDLFSEKQRVIGDTKSENPLISIYKNKDGKIEMPENIVHDMTRKIPGEEEKGIPPVAIDDFEGLVNRYIKRMQNGTAKRYIPDWSKMISYLYPKKMLKEMSDIKQSIRVIAKNNNLTPGKDGTSIIVDKLNTAGEGVGMGAISRFAGVDPEDPENVKKQKIDDFIYMTLSESEFDVQWFENLGSRREGGSLENVEKKVTDPAYNLKAFIGNHYYKMLGYLANKRDAARDAADALVDKASKKMEDGSYYTPTPEDIQAVNEANDYTDDSLSVAIGLLDHHGDIRNFLRNGAKINDEDWKGRTNTELYYSLRGVDPPEHIDALIDLYNKGTDIVQKEQEQKEIAKKTGQPVPTDPNQEAAASWFQKFFAEYRKFDPIARNKDLVEQSIARINDIGEEHYQKYNAKILHYLQHPKKNPPDKDYRDKLRTVSRLYGDDKAMEVDAIIQQWRDESSEHLPDDIYAILGFTKFQDGLESIKARKEDLTNGWYSELSDRQKAAGKTPKFNKGIKQYEAEATQIKQNLKEMIESNANMLVANDIDPDTYLSRLRLASAAYDRALVKIAALEKMKKCNIKLASTDRVDYIDLQIARVKAEFDHYFNSLFS